MLIPRGILALRDVAAQEKTRYAMNGLLLTRTSEGRARIVATDGKALAQVTFDDGLEADTFPEISGINPRPHATRKLFSVVPGDAIHAAQKAMPRKALKPAQRMLCVDETGEDSIKLATIGADFNATVTDVRLVDGHFPPHEDVMASAIKQTEKAGIKIGVNIEILNRLALSLLSAASALGKEGSETLVSLEFSSAQNAIVVRVPGVSSCVGLLMPVNLSDRSAGEWSQSAMDAWNEPASAETPETPAPSVPACASAPENTPAPIPQEPAPVSQDKPETAPIKPKGKGGRKPLPRCPLCQRKMVKGTPAGEHCQMCSDSLAFVGIVKLSADSRETLRSCDVDRVMSEADKRGEGFRERFRSWMLGALGGYQHGTCGALTSWRPETPETAGIVTLEIRTMSGEIETRTFPADTAAPIAPSVAACQEAPASLPAPMTPETPASAENKPETPGIKLASRCSHGVEIYDGAPACGDCNPFAGLNW